MGVVLFDSAERNKLFPLTFTRAVGDIRLGLMTLQQWWQHLLHQPVFLQTEEYLSPLYDPVPAGDHLYIDAGVMPCPELVDQVLRLQPGDALHDNAGLVAYNTVAERRANCTTALRRLSYPWQIFQWNDDIMRQQFDLVKATVETGYIAASNRVIAPERIILEEGANIEHVVLNASTGPIYIGANATIMDGVTIRGPFALGEGSVVKMGARIYGATTVGKHCVVGGEIKNSVLFDYSNKAHDGYLGDSVIGAWCNLGAGTTNSNVKNNAGQILMQDYDGTTTEAVGQKCGVIMGDYTRTAINSSINTGSMYGISANVFGNGLLPRRLKNFSWGVVQSQSYQREKVLRDIASWMHWKDKTLSTAEEKMIEYIFENFNGTNQ